MNLFFDWDIVKAENNRKKHNITFYEAKTVFLDEYARTFEDINHSNGELRELIIGYSTSNKLIIVSFTQRNEKIRIISARKVTKKKENFMKNTTNKKEENIEDEMLNEYDLDFSKSKPNRFAKLLKSQSNYIELEPDIEKVFKTSEEVNNALRAFINAIPKNQKRKYQKI